MRTLWFAVLVIVLAVMVPSAALSADAERRWVEVDVSPHADGKADIIYKIRYRVNSGQIHGFYFEGFDGATPHFDYDNSNAVTASGRKYRLSISEVESGRYDVVLADGEAFGPGEITYIILYGADLGEAGMLDYTQSQFGKLVVFNWAPVQWDEPL
jgi:hypothetical protein